MTRRNVLLLLVLILLAGALLRIPLITETPPGLHFDEAANGILAGDIGVRGDRPVFITSYTGKEPIFFYAAGGLMRLIGESTFTLRLTAVYIGLLTIAATYWLGRELLADRRMAVIAAGLLAVSFWHLLFSRLGFRAISQPLLQALALAALFHGLRKEQWRWLLLGGIFLGLAAYTYLAIRIFPVLLLVGCLPLLLNRQTMRYRVIQLGLFGLTAIIVSLPLLIFFYNHPDTFWVRISQVAPADSGPDLIQSYVRTLGMFFLVGDPYIRFNIPNQPLFTWIWGGFLLVGWLLLLLRWRRWWYDWQKSAVILLLLNPFIMILASSLAVNEIVPSNLRAIGLMPLIYFLPAVGLVFLLEQLAGLLRRPDLTITHSFRRLHLLNGYDINYTVVVILILVIGIVNAGRDYFVTWAGESQLFYAADADLVQAAAYLDEQADVDGTIYVAALHYRHPTMAFLSEKYNRIKWLPQSEALVFPAAGPAFYLYPHSSPPPEWSTPYLPPPVANPTGPDGTPVFTAFQVPDPMPIMLAQPLQMNFDNQIQLVGYEMEPGAQGEAISLLLHWQINDGQGPGLQPFVHLEDNQGFRWSQVETFAYPSEQWTSGETILQRVAVPVPPGTPPGDYRLRVGIFNDQTGQRLPRLDDQGRYAGDSVYLEPAPVLAGNPPDPVPVPPFGMPVTVRPGLEWLGYELADRNVDQGEILPLSLWWLATEKQPNLLVRLELIRSDNTGRILADFRPGDDTFPFHAWPPSLFLIDRSNPTIPPTFPPGEYMLNLRLLDENGISIFSETLGQVTIKETVRSFTVPVVSNPLSANLGDEILMHGYELDELEPGRYHLSLVWQAMREPAADYTVFVHLLHPDGTCCAWQADRYPVEGTYPTRRWLPGEVVIDTYEIILPPERSAGDYPLEIGLYIAETGRRLAVTIPDLPVNDAVYLPPLEIQNDTSAP